MFTCGMCFGLPTDGFYRAAKVDFFQHENETPAVYATNDGQMTTKTKATTSNPSRPTTSSTAAVAHAVSASISPKPRKRPRQMARIPWTTKTKTTRISKARRMAITWRSSAFACLHETVDGHGRIAAQKDLFLVQTGCEMMLIKLLRESMI